MLTWFREKFGKVIVGGIVALLSAVFVFYGVFTPKASRGGGSGAIAGEVNGDPIPLSEFNRAYNRQIEFFKNMMGGKVSEEQLKNFNIRRSVFQELVRRRMMIQEAQKLGYLPADEEVREQINKIPAFQNEGHFDLERYRAVLSNNGYTPASFERMLREDLAVEKFQDFFRARVNVSEDEIKQQYIATGDKRNIKYVLLTNEVGKKDAHVEPAEIQKFLADSAKVNLVKSQYETKKATLYKGKTFDSVKSEIARDLIASTHMDDITKANHAIADRILKVMTASKSSDAAVNQVLKPYGIQVKSTGMISRDVQYVPGIGEAKELLTDAFAEKSPIDPAQGGRAKAYPQSSWVLVAVVSESQRPDLAKLSTEHDNVARQIMAKKERSLFEAWLTGVEKKAKIETNPSVVGGKET